MIAALHTSTEFRRIAHAVDVIWLYTIYVQLLRVLCCDFRLIWALFCLFTAGHLYANYCAVKAVRIETFNQVRLHFVAQRYFARPHDVMTVAEANYLEPVVWGTCVFEFLRYQLPVLRSVIRVFVLVITAHKTARFLKLTAIQISSSGDLSEFRRFLR